MATLSVLYIVRNEEQLIGKSAASVSAIADEIVFVDTGSRDQTLQACRQFKNAKIFSHPWTHDFSKPKNFGISKCGSEWILCLDADEMLDANGAAEIKDAIDNAKSNVSAFGLHIVDHEAAWDPAAPANPTSHFRSPQVRLFRRGNIFFQGKVMESVDASALALGSIDVLPTKLHHYLWRGRGKAFASARLEYYKKLGSSVPELGEHPRAAPVPANQVGIVVVAHNCLNLTRDCLRSVAEHTKAPYSLHLVDNGSGDGTAEFMAGISGKKPVRLASNYGAAKGRNMGMREALSNPAVRHVCILDNDVKVSDGWIEPMLEVLQANPDIGAIGPLALNAEGAQKFDGKAPDVPFALVEGLAGFCMVFPIEVLRKVGLFDESFGQYGLYEVDFCRRLREAGYKIAVANKSFVDHLGRGTISGNRINWQGSYAMALAKFKKKWKGVEPPPLPEPRVAQPLPDGQSWTSTKNPKTSIVILTHNRLDMTKDCLASVCAHAKESEIIVVDNGSTDGTVNWIRQNVPYATIIENSANLGIPKARNQGIKKSRGDHVLMIDNDVVVKEGWLDDLFAELGKGFDIVGTEGWQFDVNFTPVMKCERKGNRCDYVGGACTLAKREVYERAGLLDEGFGFAYFEDAEVCFRAKKCGLKFSWLLTDKVVHREHATLLHEQKTFHYQDAWNASHRRMQQIGRKEIVPVVEKLAPRTVPVTTNQGKLKILYLGMQWDYGDRSKGNSFEHDNFFPSIRDWDGTAEMLHFDFVELGQKHGIPKMTGMLMDAVGRFCPDAIFAVFFDEQHDPNREVFDRIRKTTKAKSIGWFCDSHYRFDSFDCRWAPHLDFCVTTAQVAIQKYRERGFGGKVIKSQWFASPPYRKIPGTPRDIDVSFVGQPHGDRRAVVDALKGRGISVQTFGKGWATRLPFDEMIRMFNRSKINLNLNNAADARTRQIKGRNFEVPACGGFLLTGTAENLEEYYVPDKEIVTFAGVEQMAERIKYYLAHDAEREAIAEAGYKRTMAEHTYKHRLDAIFREAGLLGGAK